MTINAGVERSSPPHLYLISSSNPLSLLNQFSFYHTRTPRWMLQIGGTRRRLLSTTIRRTKLLGGGWDNVAPFPSPSPFLTSPTMNADLYRVLEDGTHTQNRLGIIESLIPARSQGPIFHYHEMHDEGFVITVESPYSKPFGLSPLLSPPKTTLKPRIRKEPSASTPPGAPHLTPKPAKWS